MIPENTCFVFCFHIFRPMKHTFVIHITYELGYKPLKEIIIHIGEKGEFIDTEPVRVYVDGEKIENLRGFKFKAKMGESPEMTVKRAIFCSQSNLSQNGCNNPSHRPVPVHSRAKDISSTDTEDNSDCKQ